MRLTPKEMMQALARGKFPARGTTNTENGMADRVYFDERQFAQLLRTIENGFNVVASAIIVVGKSDKTLADVLRGIDKQERMLDRQERAAR